MKKETNGYIVEYVDMPLPSAPPLLYSESLLNFIPKQLFYFCGHNVYLLILFQVVPIYTFKLISY